jgi:hypothetical protein
VVRTLTQALADTDSRAAWIIDQAGGVDPIRRGIERRGMPDCLSWLPR